ncbi:MAG: fibronectin type III domain-containing protein, partial [Gammaproteobacteria bacterium]
PLTPQGAGLQAPAGGGVTLTWSMPAGDGGAAITQYRVRWAESAAPGVYLGQGANHENGSIVPGGAGARAFPLRGLKKSTQYDAQVAAENRIGIGAWSPVQRGMLNPTAAPLMPQGAGLLTQPGGGVTLTWRMPAGDGGAAITQYRVRWAESAAPGVYLGDGENGSIVPGGAGARAYPLRGLRKFTQYDVQVAAENRIGIGAWSPAQRGMLNSAPAAPQNVRISPADSALNLSWEAPANNGGSAISGYRVRWADASDAGTWVNPAGASGEEVSGGAAVRMYTVTGLTNGSEYEVQMAAVNAVGTGAFGASVRDAPTMPPGIPGALAAETGTGRLILTWTAPTESDREAVTGYAVRWAEGAASTDWVTPPGDAGLTIGASPRYVLRRLKSTATYEVQIAARNAAGFGAWTQSAQGKTAPFDLDVDESGGAPDWMDGVMVARYLAGLRGAPLTAGVGDESPADVAAKIDSGVLSEDLDVDGANGVTAADGIMVARYLLGVTEGAALTDGQTDAANEAAVKAKIMEFLPQ